MEDVDGGSLETAGEALEKLEAKESKRVTETRWDLGALRA